MFENLPIADDEDSEFMHQRVLKDLLGRVDVLVKKKSGFDDGLNELIGDLSKTNVRLAASVWAGVNMVVESLKADTFGELPDEVYWEVGWNIAVTELGVLGLIDRALGRQRANRH